MAIDQFSLSKPSPRPPHSKLKGMKPLKYLSRKRPYAPKRITKKVKREKPEMSKRIEGEKAIICSEKAKMSKRIEGEKAMICSEMTNHVMKRAEEVRANLAPEFPSFVKSMLPSHVTGGFWLGLSRDFCARHLPIQDETVILVNEAGEEHRTKYLVNKNGLSAGWRGFSIAHKLLPGDALVFQLVRPCKFQVYIIRANALTEVDGAMGLLCLDVCEKTMNIEYPLDMDAEPTDVKKGSQPKDAMVVLSTDLGPPASDQSICDVDDIGSEVMEGIRFSESIIDFKDVKCFDNFTILVDGLVVDSEAPPHIRSKYYELCVSQEAFLHDHLVKGVNCKLAAGIVCETVNIADAIRASKLTTSKDNLATWDSTLKAFEDLGMNVGFLRARVSRLMSLPLEFEKVIESKMVERVPAVEEVKMLEAKRLEAELALRRLDDEIESAKLERGRLEFKFQEEANAKW